MRATIALLVVSLGGCRCDTPLALRPEADWIVSPNPLTLPPVYVGQRSSAALSVDNLGGVSASATVTIDAPFTASTDSLRLGSGESRELIIEAVPTTIGTTTATLRIGTLEVPVSVDAREVPPCTSTACSDARFDVEQGACVSTSRPDGLQCDDGCVTGTCRAGTCEGVATACDDGDACSTDACGANGCVHVPTRCPSAGLCTVPTCDSTTGCGTTEAPDGTVCGTDDCRADTVDVCISGRCVTRPRPNAGRCVNTWVPGTIASRSRAALAWDETRGRVVLFGGYTSWGPMPETWEWNGSDWEIRTPANSPPPLYRPAMAFDLARSRTVLLAPHGDRTSEVWEWDGVTWLLRSPKSACPPTHGDPNYASVGIAYDVVRRVTVIVFFKLGQSEAIDTWEWNGSTWRQRMPTTVPRIYYGAARLTWDGGRQRVLLTGISYGAQGSHDNAVWEWDGNDWSDRSSTAADIESWGTYQEAPVWDPTRRELVMKATGRTITSDGTRWSSRAAMGGEPIGGESPMVFDTVRRQLVLFDGSRTWTWDGARWLTLSEDKSPQLTAIITDTIRQRVLGFGLDDPPDLSLWKFDGRGWSRVSAANAPPGRVNFGVAFDPLRDRVVLFGGTYEAGNETWEFDGTSWARRTPPHSPPAREKASMIWDPVRQRVLLFGGERMGTGYRGDFWAWDGTDWVELASALPPRASAPMVWDSTAQRALLFGGVPFSTTMEVWSWDSAWTQLPAGMPPAAPTFIRAIADDPSRGTLLGIQSVSFNGMATWEYGSAGWTARTPTVSPRTSAFPMYGAAWEPQGQHVLISGVGQTWLFLP